MTVIGTLWGAVYQRQTKLICSVAAINGFELEVPQWSWKNKPADFTSKFPYERIPAFEGADGFKVTEGAAIARYLSSIWTRVNLLGSSPQEAAIVDQWVHFAEHEIGIPDHTISGLIYGFCNSTSFNREVLDKNTERLLRALDHLESHLAMRSGSGYVALDTLTLADFMVASTIYAAASVSLGSTERTRYPHVFAHYAKVTEDERVKQYWGTETFVDVRVTEPTTISLP